MKPLPEDAEAVLAFWFGLRHRNRKDDARVRAALGGIYERARAGALDGWADRPRPRLALILLLDQVPRHLFRDRAEAYVTDGQAQALTARFVAEGGWEGFSPLERYFALAPWLHAEQPALQEQACERIRGLAGEDAALELSAAIAELYRETIRRFGRFPHRNVLLGRESTPAEREFLEREWPARRRLLPRDREE